MKFTQKSLASLDPRERRYKIQDDNTPHFYIIVQPSGKKSFKIYRRIRGRANPITVHVGDFPDMNLVTAKSIAAEFNADISNGINPNERNKVDEVAMITFSDAFNEYLTVKTLAPRTVADYKKTVERNLSDWLRIPMRDITPAMVDLRYRNIADRSTSEANKAFRIFRAIYNDAHDSKLGEDRKPLLPENPTSILKRQWKKLKPKRTIIRAADLSIWFSGVSEIKTHYKTRTGEQHWDSDRDSLYAYIYVMLFTSLRGDELRRLAASIESYRQLKSSGGSPKGYYDEAAGLFYFFDQKNHEEAEVPLSSYVLDCLSSHASRTGWLFTFNNKSLEYGKANDMFIWVEKRSGVKARGHDLRRTFSTVANSLMIPKYTLKRLLGHKIDYDSDNDVTGGYVNPELDTIRLAAEQIGEMINEKITKAP